MSKSKIAPGDGDPRHGTTNGYGNLGCRCAECREAHRLHFIKVRASHPEYAHRAKLRSRARYDAHCKAAGLPIPIRREPLNPQTVRLLLELGYSTSEVAEKLDYGVQTVRKYAKSIGWTFNRPNLNRQRVAELTAEGLGCNEISRRIGLDKGQVSRYQKQLREATT